MLLTRDDFTLVMREVPAEICEICGEDYIDGDGVKTSLSSVRDDIASGNGS